jgi:hypothetical protein
MASQQNSLPGYLDNPLPASAPSAGIPKTPFGAIQSTANAAARERYDTLRGDLNYLVGYGMRNVHGLLENNTGESKSFNQDLMKSIWGVGEEPDPQNAFGTENMFGKLWNNRVLPQYGGGSAQKRS